MTALARQQCMPASAAISEHNAVGLRTELQQTASGSCCACHQSLQHANVLHEGSQCQQLCHCRAQKQLRTLGAGIFAWACFGKDAALIIHRLE